VKQNVETLLEGVKSNMSVLARQRRDWDELAGVDAMWAVLTYSEKKGCWSEEEFFAHGEEEIAVLMKTLESLGYPKKHETALDFGCGVGRLTRAMTRRFSRVFGIDISATMIEAARRYTPSAAFAVNESTLLPFPDKTFDLVYTRIVLQHLPSKDLILDYTSELLRVIKEGGIAVFQFPTKISFLHRIQPRRRVYSALRKLGVSPSKLFKANLTPMRMVAISEKEMDTVVANANCQLVHVVRNMTEERHQSSTYYVARTR
jgi:SAM-dependent methyltransferase